MNAALAYSLIVGGLDPLLLLWIGGIAVVLAALGVWADRIDRRNPR